MDKKQVMVYVAAILTTLAELNTEAPESTVYIALGMDIHKYHAIRDLLVSNNLVTVSHHLIALTDHGRELARQCEAVLPSA